MMNHSDQFGAQESIEPRQLPKYGGKELITLPSCFIYTHGYIFMPLQER